MGEVHAAGHVVRIGRGHLSDEELAAVTAVLCAVLARRAAGRDDGVVTDAPRWSPENPVLVYRSPHSWHGGPPLPASRPAAA